VTQASIGRRIAIVLDGVVQSAPVINSPIREDGTITGRFTRAEVESLAQVLRAGSLPAPVTVVAITGP
jgi:preprotein translocase subunit SecD